MADIDTRKQGKVFYREETKDAALLKRASSQVQKQFSKFGSFKATGLFIATWDKVGRYSRNTDNKANTFQIVLASNGKDTFCFLHYLDNGITWIQGEGKTQTGAKDIMAQAGFENKDGRNTIIPGSRTPDAYFFANWTNTDMPGAWLYHIGIIKRDVEVPDLNLAGAGASEVLLTVPQQESCALGSKVCTKNAHCTDYSPGFCCVCSAPFYGNGKVCLEPGVPQRVNGKVNGVLNGIQIRDADLHSYIVTEDGRTYTAVNRIPQGLGKSMMTLTSIGGMIRWLFARPSKSASAKVKNGFMMTGGVLRREASINYPQQNKTVQIIQQFHGQDALNYMRMDTSISGEIPVINADVEMSDYVQVFRRVAPGRFTSYSAHGYATNGIRNRFTVQQTVTFDECRYEPNPEDMIRLTVKKMYVSYSDQETTTRYSSHNKIEDSASQNPCQLNNQVCATNARCVPSGSTYVCQCKTGYQGNGLTCRDINECLDGSNNCDVNARCFNVPGNFVCRCRLGYRGNGVTCQRDLTCQDLSCDRNARCVFDSQNQRPKCECNSGFHGNGVTCTAIELQCNVLNNCDAHASCIFNGVTRTHSCQCDQGYTGDGLTCRSVKDCRVEQNCHKDATCRSNGQCQCHLGWQGDGYTCRPTQCNALPTLCGANAFCFPDNVLRKYVCRCNKGYVGDGITCTKKVTACNIINNCGANAECIQTIDSSFRCQCLPGFEGDGLSCAKPPNCQQNPRLCDVNAACVRSGGDFVCLCNHGYQGDGRRCTVVQVSDSFLMFAQGMSIMQVPFGSSQNVPSKQVVMIPGQTAVGIDVDCVDKNVYWTDVSGRSVSKASLDGKNIQKLVTGLGSPEGIAIDWIARNMYFTDSGLDKIYVSRLDGSHQRAVVKNGLVNPRAIVVDPSRGKLYWADWNRASPKIEVSFMDGSGRRPFVSTGLRLPNGLTIDYYAHQLCWADAGTQKIECIRLNGAGRRVVYSLTPYPFDVTLANNNFYWSDWQMKSIPNIPMQGGSPNEPLALPNGGNGKLYGIVAVRGQCPPATNACSINNGGCRYLCLPNGDGRTCACPDNSTDDACNQIVTSQLLN